MKTLLLGALALILTACASEPRVKVYGIIPNKTVVVAQVCLKDTNAQPLEPIRYSLLLKNLNYIRVSEAEKINDHYYFSAPTIEKRLLVGFFLPFDYKAPQTIGYMWNMKQIEVSSSKWTPWLEPTQTVQDILDRNFKEDNGMIGRKEKEESDISPFLVRFKQMHLDDYIQERVKKKDQPPPCLG